MEPSSRHAVGQRDWSSVDEMEEVGVLGLRELIGSKVVQALRELEHTGSRVTFEAVSGVAGVSRSWLYTQPDLKTEIQRLRKAECSRGGHVVAPVVASVGLAAPNLGSRHVRVT